MTDAPSTVDAPLPSVASQSGPATDIGWFVDASGWIVRGALILGALRGLQQLAVAAASPLDGLPHFLAAVAALGAEVVGFGVGGLAVAALVRALGAWAGSISRTDCGVSLPAEVLLRAISSPMPAQAVRSPLVADGARLAEVRRLMREAAWDEAQEAVQAFRAESPDDPRGAEASDALEAAKRTALERLEAELKAARSVNDPEQAMEIHARIQPLIHEGARGELDSDLSRWFLMTVHRRLRAGRIQTDVVALADRVADRFGHTKEGASLRAALPTLRRSAGLCPRCGKPFTGAADACPECLGGSSPSASIDAPDEEDEYPVERREPDWFSEPSGESAAWSSGDRGPRMDVESAE